MGLYKSLTTIGNGFGVDEAPYLCGFVLGNSYIGGCLTHDTQSVRVHSCEPGVACSSISSGPSVYITPIVTRTTDGFDVLELGAGGGLGDLAQTHELELPDDVALERLTSLCADHIQDPTIQAAIVKALTEAYESKSKSLSLDAYGIKDEDNMSLQNLVTMLGQGSRDSFPGVNDLRDQQPRAGTHLPNTIVRHLFH